MDVPTKKADKCIIQVGEAKELGWGRNNPKYGPLRKVVGQLRRTKLHLYTSRYRPQRVAFSGE